MNEEILKKIINTYSELETKLIKELVEHFKINEEFINSDYWRLEKLEELGLLNQNIVNYISEKTKTTPKEIEEALNKIGFDALNMNNLNNAYKGGFIQIDPSILLQKQTIQNMIKHSYRELNKSFFNLNTRIENATRDTYNNIINKTYIQMSQGMTYQEAIRNSLIELGNEGIKTLTYKIINENGEVTGIRNYDIEGAVRRELITATQQLTNKINENIIEELDVQYIYLSEHIKCREDHFPWQGTIIKRSDLVKVTKYGEVDGLAGPNCKHYMKPYFGTARGNELKKISKEEALKQYELAQKQRYIERGIRKWKRKAEIFKNAEDKEYCDKCKEKIKEWQKRNQHFVKNNNLRRDFSRENVEKVTKVPKSDILKANNNNQDIFNSKVTKLEKIKNISDKSKTAVLEKYEKQIVNKEFENAVIIDTKGQTYLLEGNSTNSIYIKNMEEKLHGAYMTHNHPENETRYSFSVFDISEFMGTEMQKLRGIDHKYIYEIEKTKDTIKVDRDTIVYEFGDTVEKEAWEIIFKNGYDADEELYHLENQIMSKKYKYKYRRIKR